MLPFRWGGGGVANKLSVNDVAVFLLENRLKSNSFLI